MIRLRNSSTEVQGEDKRINTKGKKKDKKGDGDPEDHGEEECVVLEETVTKSQQDIQETDQMMTMRFIKQFYPHVIPIEDEEELGSQEEPLKTAESRERRSAQTTRSETSAFQAQKTTDSNTQTCGVCKKLFPYGEAFRTHRCAPVRSNSACPHCGKHFASPSAVNIHVRVHTGERPHACLVCGKAFTQKGNLQAHQRLHTGERPFKCNQCEKTYVQKAQLNQHLVMSHKMSHKNVNGRAQNRLQR